MAVIRIRDLPLEVRIGALPEERVSPQTVRADIEVRIDDTECDERDSLDATLDYTLLAAAVRDVSAPPCHLVETMARRIHKRVVSLDRVRWARVRVRKFNPPGMGDVAYVEVEEEGGPG